MHEETRPKNRMSENEDESSRTDPTCGRRYMTDGVSLYMCVLCMMKIVTLYNRYLQIHPRQISYLCFSLFSYITLYRIISIYTWPIRTDLYLH